VSGFASTLVATWRLAIPYFRSEDRWPARGLLSAVIVIELAIVAIHVMINRWNARFFNALQDRNWDRFGGELLFFCILAAVLIVLIVYQLYLSQWLRIRWRQWMTKRYLHQWLDAGNHYRMQLLGDAADNPDQRVAEDIQIFVDRTLSIATGLLGAIVSLASFLVVLWTLSAGAPLRLFGSGWTIPGYLVWAALLLAAIGTTLAHLLGRALIKLNFNQQRFEADFRFNLVRARENSEQIALMHGEGAERDCLMSRFAAIVGNWRAIMSRQKLLTFFTAGYNQASIVFPYVVVSPAYFAGHLALGGLTQTASAFSSVQASLSFFINAYQQLAEWRAVIDRLVGFTAAITSAQALASAKPVAVFAGAASELRVEELEVRLPNGCRLVGGVDIVLPRGDRLLVTGPSGSGKSTLFRAIAGIWPFALGRITVPLGAKVLVLPQRPYLQIGSLAAALSYPASPMSFGAQQLRQVLVAVGLPALAPRLDDQAHWGRMLSLGEQQRLAIARAIMHAPDFLFLDEATASLDEPAEAALYRLLQEHLPETTLVSIGHRSTLHMFHRRHISLAHAQRGRPRARALAKVPTVVCDESDGPERRSRQSAGGDDPTGEPPPPRHRSHNG
jgi:putative ATP-binding cassette transporter